MTITITYHIMPWEIDYALLSFSQLKRSKYFIDNDIKIKIKSALNISSQLVDWKETKFPKEYFIEKYKTISILLKDYEHTSFIYDGDRLWGHLDLQRDAIDIDTDYYISICPDMYFSEHLLKFLIESTKYIKNEYFVITPQICRMWDTSWEIITHSKFAVGPHYGWEKTTDIFDVDNYLHTSNEEISIEPINQNKWAGWFDLYNKKFYEKLVRIPDEWSGYGGWDTYSLIVSNFAKSIGYDFQQYKLNGQIIFEYGIGPLNTDTVQGFSNYYKNFIVKKDVSEQRESFNNKLNSFIEKRISLL